MKKLSALLMSAVMVFSLCFTPVSAATIKSPKITSVTAKSDYGYFNFITVKWKKQKDVSGYIIYQKIGNGSYKKIKTIKDKNKTSYVIKGVEWAKKCTYRIKTYKVKNGKKIYSAKSKAVYTYSKPMDAPFVYVKSSGKNKIKLKWLEVPHADGYAIYQKVGKKFKRIATVKSANTLTYTVKNLKKNTEYTFTVSSYIKRGGKNYYSMKTFPKSATANKKYPTVQLNKKIKYYGYTGVLLMGDINKIYERTPDLTQYGIKNSDQPAFCPSEYYDVKTKEPIWFLCSQEVADKAFSGDGSMIYFIDRLENGRCGAPANVKK